MVGWKREFSVFQRNRVFSSGADEVGLKGKRDGSTQQ